jgi:hypothetical protein
MRHAVEVWSSACVLFRHSPAHGLTENHGQPQVARSNCVHNNLPSGSQVLTPFRTPLLQMLTQKSLSCTAIITTILPYQVLSYFIWPFNISEGPHAETHRGSEREKERERQRSGLFLVYPIGPRERQYLLYSDPAPLALSRRYRPLVGQRGPQLGYPPSRRYD